MSRRALLAGIAGTGLTGLLAACSSGSAATSRPRASGARSTPAGARATPSHAASASSKAPVSAGPTTDANARTITVSSIFDDGTVVGVGMPIVLLFDPSPTDATGFVKAARVTVDGQPVDGAWRWSQPYAGEPMQAHYRLENYWPANSTIELELPVGGLSAGKGLAFSDALSSLRLRTGDKRVTTVDGATERAVVMVNDKYHRTMRASLGKSSTPTTVGTKLVMQKGETLPGSSTLRPDGAVRMQNTAHTYDLVVDWSVRVTQSGEYLHAAPWNSQIGQTSTSDGCTNLSTANAEWYYQFSRIGDVVIHKNTGGAAIPLWDGYTDWNIPWSTYRKGGLLPPA